MVLRDNPLGKISMDGVDREGFIEKGAHLIKRAVPVHFDCIKRMDDHQKAFCNFNPVEVAGALKPTNNPSIISQMTRTMPRYKVPVHSQCLLLHLTKGFVHRQPGSVNTPYNNITGVMPIMLPEGSGRKTITRG